MRTNRNRWIGLTAAVVVALAIGLLPALGKSGGDRDISLGLLRTPTPLVWKNQPRAEAVLGGSTALETRYDADDVEQARINVAVVKPGAADALLVAEYSTDDGKHWQPLGTDGYMPAVAINSAGLKTSKWIAIDSAAKDDVMFRVAGVNGDGRTDPSLGRVDIQFRQQT